MEGSCLQGLTHTLEFRAYEDIEPGACSGPEILAGKKRLDGVFCTIREGWAAVQCQRKNIDFCSIH